MMPAQAATSAPQRMRSALVPLVLIATIVALSAIAAIQLANGSKIGLASALAAAAAPLLVYLAIWRPFVFPFGLYAALVPFEHIVVIHGFGTLTKLSGMLASAALLFYIVRSKRIINPSRTLYAWLALVVWACASAIWAVDQPLSLSLIAILLQLFALFAVSALVPIRPDELRILLFLVAVGGIAAAAYGGKLFLASTQTEGNRLFIESSTAGDPLDPNHFAGSLLLPIAIVLVYALSAPRILYKLVAFAGLGVLLLGVYASGSRGGLVALVSIFLFVLWRTRKWFQLGLIMAVGAVLGVVVKSAVWERFSADFATGSGRNSIWSIGLHAFMQRPFFGWGVGNFPDAYNQWLLRLYSPLFTKWDRGAHDLLLTFAVELGVVGLALVAWVTLEQARAMRRIQPSSELYSIRIALEAAFVGLLVVSLFLDTLYWKYGWLILTSIMLARSASFASDQRSERVASDSPSVMRRARAPDEMLGAAGVPSGQR